MYAFTPEKLLRLVGRNFNLAICSALSSTLFEVIETGLVKVDDQCDNVTVPKKQDVKAHNLNQ
jgi:hypothetical protein